MEPRLTDTGNTDGDSTASDLEYVSEIRFGVVMYGGVSLAIYINGVANEIYELACATPRDGVVIDVESTGLPTTRDLYRRLAWLVGSDALRADYARRICDARQRGTNGDWDDVWAQVDTSTADCTRFAVDVVSGTSAGGINGLFLAKALANGEQFAPLKDLWIDEGDFSLLLNDKPTYQGVEPPIAPRYAQPASLLNSDRMYAKLYDALSRMAPIPDVRGDGAANPPDSPLADQIDCFLTTTDIRGSPVPLRLFDKVVYERRYKQSYRFSYPDGITQSIGTSVKRNDFAPANIAFMAFAARCTSSFPFAFEPMTLSTVTRLGLAGDAPGVRRWDGFFPNLPKREVAIGAHVERAFGDGGYLDNKPFTYVVDTLARRFSAVPLERKLIYVEPAPEHFDPDAPSSLPDAKDVPDALENALAALTSIPQYETIREDLQSILARNKRVERIERVVRLSEDTIRVAANFQVGFAADGSVRPWAELGLSEMVRYYGTAFLPYQRLRVYAVTDTLADRTCRRLGIDRESDQQYAMRALVRVWREAHFVDEVGAELPTVNAFLDQFDADYRGRRTAFLMRNVDVLLRLYRRRATGLFTTGASARPAGLSDEEWKTLQLLRADPDFGSPADLDRAYEAVRTIKRGLYEARRMLVDRLDQLDQPIDDATKAGLFGYASLAALHADLDPVLLEVLGHAEVSATDDPCAARQARPRARGDATVAAASRTLQEATVARAANFVSTDGAADTALERWLAAMLDTMRVKGDGSEAGGEPGFAGASALTWMLLGGPTLQRVPGTDDATAVVGDVDAAHFEAHFADPLNTAEGRALRRFLAFYYLRFDSYDQISFPLYYDTGTGEPSTVDVVRVSPVDATNLIDEAHDPAHRKKLAGTALSNFGAFLDKRWRLNDNMWGQLDGAERLIEALLPMSDPDTRIVRQELIERAHRRILQDALVPDGQAELAGVVAEALADVGSSMVATTAADRNAVLRTQMATLFSQLSFGRGSDASRMLGVLESLLSAPALMEFVRRSRANDPEPDPEATMKSAARAVNVAGLVLEGIGERRSGMTTKMARWLARFGSIAQGIVAVSIPGSFATQIWRHVAKLLYAFEIVLIGLAFLLGSPDMRTLGISAFATTVAVHLLTLIAGDVVRDKRPWWLYGAGLALLTALVAFAGIGVLVVVHQGSQQQLCWTNPPDAAQEGIAADLCRSISDARSWWTRFGRRPASE